MQFKLHVSLEKQFYYFTGQVYGLLKKDDEITRKQKPKESQNRRRPEGKKVHWLR